MKTTIQNMSWKNWKINVALLVLGLTLSGVILEARGGKPSSQTSICVAFDDLAGDRVKSDGGSYCDSEPDVAASSAPGFILITDDNAGPRKLSLDFQVPIRIDKAALLAPSGLYEARTWLNAQNDALANCIGERPTGTMILSMTPGQQLYAGLLIDFTNGKGGRWLLSFGDAVRCDQRVELHVSWSGPD